MADASPAPQPSPGIPQQAPETPRPGPSATEAAAAAPAGRRGNRLAWLDALRGFAALCVVFDHAGSVMFWHVRAATYQWIDTGQYGVFVFFLVSGYIVPASLERKGSVRTFWVSRVFRLYPLYILALAAGLVLWRVGWGELRTGSHPAVSALAHSLMLSNVLAVPNAINVVWTLSYEMAFYLLLTALFVAGVHRRSSWYALAFAVAAVGVGGLLPMTALSDGPLGTKRVAVIAAVLIVGGVGLAVGRNRIPRLIGAMLAATAAMALVAFNGTWVHPFEALTILALMFTGTMLYRAESGQFPKRRAAVLAVTTFVLVIAAGLGNGPPHPLPGTADSALMWQRQWVSTLVLAGLTFALGLAVRNRRIPSALAWLGLVSYSLYLLHPLVLHAYETIPGTGSVHSVPERLTLIAAFLAVLLGVCALTYYLVEAPMQRQGRKLARWLDRQLGPDRPGDGQPQPRVPEPAVR